jgi:hypothetical protein
VFLRYPEMSHLDELLKELRDEVRELRKKMSMPLPRVLTQSMAAEQLSISVSKLKGMIRAGGIATCTVGDRKMIPLTEIERIARPSKDGATEAPPPPRTSGGRKKASTYDAAAEAAAIRASLRQRR